jgi:Na+/melibiose symporter-like transporter
MGFVPGLPRTATQPESALLAITLSMAVIPAITNTLKVVLALQFRLPEPVPDAVQTPENAGN